MGKTFLYIFLLFNVIYPTLAVGGERVQETAWQSWMVDHPARAGILSGLTFGLWPKSFADDKHPADVNGLEGVPTPLYEFAEKEAKSAFSFWQKVGTLLLGGVAAGLCRKRRKVDSVLLPPQ